MSSSCSALMPRAHVSEYLVAARAHLLSNSIAVLESFTSLFAFLIMSRKLSKKEQAERNRAKRTFEDSEDEDDILHHHASSDGRSTYTSLSSSYTPIYMLPTNEAVSAALADSTKGVGTSSTQPGEEHLRSEQPDDHPKKPSQVRTTPLKKLCVVCELKNCYLVLSERSVPARLPALHASLTRVHDTPLCQPLRQ